ncbi:hypothetical protein CC86DRAFT_96297 [Ophiobolus disseminans]|uniref:Uncharacterized protein n=1 Tax=Ophiobolus disseminans TaxID=1469910 RepID=A0A6A6ZM01_9PLEO|nr:hypothetical protein CC86DRAFT_96297 [Ophiobolus disseminans]
MDVPYTEMSFLYKAQAKAALRKPSSELLMAIKRESAGWVSTKYTITDGRHVPVGEWPEPFFPIFVSDQAVFTFTQNTKYSAPPMTVARNGWLSEDESFSSGSHRYYWHRDWAGPQWGQSNTTLYKRTGKVDVEVAKFGQSWMSGIGNEGVLLVDEVHVTKLIACTTLMVALQKRQVRQEAARFHRDVAHRRDG